MNVIKMPHFNERRHWLGFVCDTCSRELHIACMHNLEFPRWHERSDPAFRSKPRGIEYHHPKSLLVHDIWNFVESRAESWYWIKGVGSQVGWLSSKLSTCGMNVIQMPCASAEGLRWTLSAALVRGSFTAIAIASKQAGKAPSGHDHGSSFTLRPHRPPPHAPSCIIPHLTWKPQGFFGALRWAIRAGPEVLQHDWMTLPRST